MWMRQRICPDLEKGGRGYMDPPIYLRLRSTCVGQHSQVVTRLQMKIDHQLTVYLFLRERLASRQPITKVRTLPRTG